MKIIFLDIDGVLNHYYSDKHVYLPKTEPFRSLMGMDKDKVEMLNQIMDSCPEWEIVISSSWYYTERTKAAFIHFGFKYLDRILGDTSHRLDGRGHQILEWVDTHDVLDFITIEDEPWDITGNHKSVTIKSRKRFKGRVFQPDLYIGLTQEMTDKIIIRCKK